MLFFSTYMSFRNPHTGACLFALMVFLLQVTTLRGQTVYNGGNLNQNSGWDNGRPNTPGNPGTVNTDGIFRNLRDYDVTQTGGDLTTNRNRTLRGGQWTLEGGSITTGATNRISTRENNIFTLDGGTLTASDMQSLVDGTFRVQSGTLSLNDDLFANSGVVDISGGASTVADRVRVANGGSVTISGGTLDAGTLGGFGGGASGSFFFNGGTTTVTNNLNFGNNTTPGNVTFTFGGTSAGSLSAAGFSGRVANRSMNFLPGTGMSVEIRGDSNWAETEWDAGRLLYDGLGASTYGDRNTVTGSGFGDGSRFQFFEDSLNANVMLLVVIPEASSLALAGLEIALLGLFLVCRNKKRQD